MGPLAKIFIYLKRFSDKKTPTTVSKFWPQNIVLKAVAACEGLTLPWLLYIVVRDLSQVMMGALNVCVTCCKSFFVSMI